MRIRIMRFVGTGGSCPSRRGCSNSHLSITAERRVARRSARKDLDGKRDLGNLGEVSDRNRSSQSLCIYQCCRQRVQILLGMTSAPRYCAPLLLHQDPMHCFIPFQMKQTSKLRRFCALDVLCIYRNTLHKRLFLK